MIKVNEIEAVLNTKIGKHKIGSKFFESHGSVYLQVFQGKKEGVGCYGILDTGYIDLKNPIWTSFKVFLDVDPKTKHTTIKEFLP
jgi:hypothetical protein